MTRENDDACALLRDHLARPARVRRKILKLGQAVFDRQHRFRVVQMNARPERQRWKHRGVNVGAAHRRMLGHHAAAASPAELPMARIGLRESPDELRAARDPDVLRFPQCERGQRAARIGPAGIAMAVAHFERRAGNLDRHAAAETAPCMRLSHAVALPGHTLLTRPSVFQYVSSLQRLWTFDHGFRFPDCFRLPTTGI